VSETTADEPAPDPNRFRRGLVYALPLLLTLGSIGYAVDFYRTIGLVLYTEQFIAGMLAIALPLTFLTFPARRGTDGPPKWYDVALALAGFAAPAWVAIDYPRLANEIAFQPTDALIIGVALLVLITEALRRAVGYTLVIMLLAFLAFALWGHHVPGKLAGRDVDLETLVINLALDPQALLGIPLKIGTTIVFAFVFMGQLLFQSGGSTFFTEISHALMGRFRGGSAKIAVTASAFFGSISGSAVSNVVSTGVITIPLMRRSGYRAEAAAAIEAVASTGGQLMPPIMGVTAFVMAEFLEIPYAEVVMVALVPAVLYYAALFFVVDLEAARAGIARLTAEQAPRALAVLKSGWYFPLPFGVLIYYLFVLNELPEVSALMGALTLLVCAVVFGYRGKRMGPRQVIEALRATGTTCVEIVLITAAAGLAIGVLNISGLSFGLTLALVQLGEGNLIVLLVSAALVCIVLGMGMPTLGVYVLLAALVAPAIVEVGIEPKAAHLFVLYFGLMSMITPPIAIAAFAAASLAKADAMRTGWTAVRYGWVAYVIPFAFVASPALLMIGEPGDIILTTAAAFAGVWLVSVAVVGFLTRPLGVLPRLLFAVAGLAMLSPEFSFVPFPLPLLGLVLGTGLAARELAAGRNARALASDSAAES
jgi:TRAP transporter 4TM/12TM fusion protein